MHVFLAHRALCGRETKVLLHIFAKSVEEMLPTPDGPLTVDFLIQ